MEDKMENKRVGIFSKIYRNEPNIHTAIESVLAQTYKNFKLYILVSDKTKQELQKYTELDSRVLIIEGIRVDEEFWDHAKDIAKDGNDFLSTIDGDDWYAPTYLEELVAFTEANNTDISMVGSYFVDLKQGKILHERKQQKMICERAELVSQLPYIYVFLRTLWGKLYRSEVILAYKDEEISIIDKCGRYGTDTVFILNLLRYVNRIGIDDKVLHYYGMSDTSNTHRFVEGRQDVDEILYVYAEQVMKELGNYTVREQMFLLHVYGSAMIDTINLLYEVDLEESERIKILLYILKKETTKEFLKQDRNGRLERNFTNQIKELIFGKYWRSISDISVMTGYLEVLEILYPKLHGVFSEEEFAMLLYKKEISEALLRGNYALLFDLLLDCVKELSEPKQIHCMKLLKRFSKEVLLQHIWDNSEFVTQYAEIIKKVSHKEYAEALNDILLSYEQGELNVYRNELVDLWINLAATLETEALFVLGKQIKVECLCQDGEKEAANKEYAELLSLGINDDNMVYLKQTYEILN